MFNQKTWYMVPSTHNFSKTVKKIIFAVVILSISLNYLHAQYNIDSIRALSYKDFEEYFRKSNIDTIKDIIYANAFLDKAKKDNDTIRMAHAYYRLSIGLETHLALQYADSIILITNNLKGHKYFPTLGYMLKGNSYCDLGKFQKAIDQYITAHQFAERNKNEFLLATIKYSLGIIKSSMGEKEDAIKIFRENLKFIQESDVPDKNFQITNTMYGIADTYISSYKYDSAAMIINNAIKICLQNNYNHLYTEFLCLCGVNLYHTKNYQSSIDSILKAIKNNDLGTNISIAYLYLGKSNEALGKKYTSLNFFLKVDSFLCNTEYIEEILLETYPPIIDFYRQKKDYANQLFYTNQLIKFDSVFNATRTIVTKDIAKKYDIPLLLASKDDLIDKLNKDMSLSAMNNFLLLIFSLLMIATAAYLILRNRRNKKRFKKVLSLLKEKEANRSLENEKQVVEENKTENTRTEIDDELVGSILNKLDKFEQSQRFTNSYTLIKLAKELKTNYTYLSKIINDHKGLSFSNYLNNLRIDLAMSRLKNDPKFRTYTIQAIAEEVGFNKAQSFSVAFHKKTGMKPSYFIKQIGKTGS